MESPLVPINEFCRLETLHGYHILDSKPESAFDELTQLASSICEAPIALISLVDENRQWFKSCIGVDAAETPREISFCAHAIHDEELFIISNALEDSRFSDNPLVQGEMGIRSYAGAPLISKNGEILGTLCVIDVVPREFTESQQKSLRILSRQVVAQFELRNHTRELTKRESRLSFALDSAQMGAFEWTISTGSIQWNREHEKLWGYQKGEFDGTYEGFAKPIHPDDLASCELEIQRCQGSGAHFDLDFRIVKSEGETRWVSSQGEFAYGEDGEAISMHGVVVDVTERRENEDKLRQQKAILKETGRIAKIGGWELELDGVTGKWTEEVCSILEMEFSPDGVADVAKGLGVFRGENREKIDRAIQDAITSGTLFDLEAEIVTPNGNPKWVRTCCRPLIENGEVKRLRGSLQDISKRKDADQKLMQVNRRFQALIEQSADVISLIDREFSYTFTSPSASRIIGTTPAESIGTPFLDKIHPDDQMAVRELLEKSVRTPNASLELSCRIRHKNESWLWIEGTVANLMDDPAVAALVLNFRDITCRRTLEEELRQSQKLEAIGQLAGGVAHDFNNILTIIHGYGSLLQMDNELNESGEDAVNQIVEASERAENLTQQLLSFSRRQVINPIHLDLNDSVTKMTKMLNPILGEDVNLQLSLGGDSLPTRADSGMIDQILLNLVVNSRDAMPAGGELRIQTGTQTLTKEDHSSIPNAVPGDYVSVSVTDTGTGISEEDMSQIFDPFFTTKDQGKGTGLGLATVFGIVNQHSGYMKVDSNPNESTTFTVFLPQLVDQEIELELDFKVSENDDFKGEEVILLVEDEIAVRNLVCTILKREGYQVIEAPHGLEALTMWEEHKDSVQLLLTDIVMPKGVSGIQLAAQLVDKSPQLPVVFMSGYSSDFAGKELTLEEGQNFIQKPATREQLLQVVRQSLDERAGTKNAA